MGQPATRGETDKPGALTVEHNGTPYHVKARSVENGPTNFVPVSAIRAAEALGYVDFRPWEDGPVDDKGRRQRVKVEPSFFMVRKPATRTKAAQAILVQGYPVLEVATSILLARLDKGKGAPKKPAASMVDNVRRRGLLGAVADLKRTDEATAAMVAARMSPELGAAVAERLQEIDADRQNRTECRQSKKVAAGHDRRVARYIEAGEGRTSKKARRTVTRKAGKKAVKKA